jgi:protein-tyrosine phosphatase
VRLLFVCTGNLCRSPVAERLTQAWLGKILDGQAAAVQVSSAGLDARDGEPMDPRSADALVRLGGDPSGFAARRFTAAMAEDADLVLTMTRQQRRSVLAATPRGLRRTFTLLEAADLIDRADLSGLERDHALRERARVLAGRLDAARAFRAASPADDIPDPIGRPERVHRTVAGIIADALKPLVTTLVPSASADDLVRSTGEG